jgi:hypothetical protein
MAEVQRKRTLVNPAKRRRKNKAKRKLSPKQIAIFGSKRQKAALKASRKRKRKNTARRANPKKTSRPRRTARRRRAKRNPGGILEVALNPARRRTKSVAKPKRRKKRSNARRRRTRRTNSAPVTRRHRRRSAKRTNRRRHHRRNPSMGGVTNLVTSAAYAIAGAVGSKYLTQMVLGASNTGYVGYAANLAAAFVGGKVVGMFTRNKVAENSVILGGVIMTLLRFLSDQTPLGSTLQAAGLSDYEASTFLTPARYVDAAKSAVVDIPTALRATVAMTPAGAGTPAGRMQRSGGASAAPAASGMSGGTYSMARSTY